MSERHHHERERFFGAAKLIAAFTLCSRVLGMVRDMAFTSLGASRATAAFVLAFQVPNVLRRLFGEGALAGAFVPVFTETNERDGSDKARRLLANAFGLLAVTLGALEVLIYAILGAIALLAPGAWDRQLLLTLTSLTMPFWFTVTLLALASAALNCRGHFAFPAFAPVLLNVFLIAAAWGVGPLLGENLVGKLVVISASMSIAGVVQLAAALWLLRASGFGIRPRLRPIEPGVRPMLRLMLPMVIGLGFLQISPFFDMFVIWVFTATEHSPTITLFGREVARPLNEAVQMRVYGAQRLYQFPMGVLAISLGVAVLPLFSRYAARGETDNLRDSINRALRLAMMEGLAAGVGMYVLAEPITRLIFVRGNYTVADAAGSAFVLKMYLLGMWAYCAFQIFSRAFFAIKQPRTPLKVSAVLVVVNVLMVMALIWVPWLRAGAFGLATATTASINVLVLAIILRKRIGGFGGRPLAVSIARSAISAGVMGGVVVGLRYLLGVEARPWLICLVCIPAGAAAFAVTARLLGATEPGELIGAIRRRKSKPAETDDGDAGDAGDSL